MAIRVFVYDDNLDRQEALKLLIETTHDMEYIGAVSYTHLDVYKRQTVLTARKNRISKPDH